jgi:hypothetical protein
MNATKYCIAVCTLLCGVASVAEEAIVQNNTWTEHFPMSVPVPQLTIGNIWGSIKVRTDDVDEVSVTISESRSAPTAELFERSMSIYFLETKADVGNVAIHVGGADRDWQRLNRCTGCRVDYQFDVVVPPGTNVDVSTVVDGRVSVSGDLATVSASNVNGPIDVDGLSNCSHVESVNGAIDLGFSGAPGSDCEIETINGDITLAVPAGAGIDMALDLFNGRIVSELDAEPMALPASVEYVADNGRHSYRIEKPAGLRIGAGGPSYRISSLNGDVRIRKL